MKRVLLANLKRAVPYTIELVLAAALLGALAIGGLFGMRALQNEVPEAQKTTVGIVLPADTEQRDLLMTMLGAYTADVIQLREFESITEGTQALRDGDFQLLIVVPRTAIADLRSGVNTPIEIRSNGELGLEEILLREMIEAGTRELSSAQAGIYAAPRLLSDLLTGETEGSVSYDDENRSLNETLNARYLSFATRNRSFYDASTRWRTRTPQETATQEKPYAQSLFLIAIATAIIVLYPLAAKDRPETWQRLSRRGLPFGVEMLSKWIAVFAVATIALFLLTSVLWIPQISEPLNRFAREVSMQAHTGAMRIQPFQVWLSLLPALAFFCGLWILLTTLVPNVYSIFAYLFLAVAILFASGNIVPPILLPFWLREAGAMLPLTRYAGVLAGIFFALLAQGISNRRWRV